MAAGTFGVVGATGQQGGAVVDALLEKGARVIAVVRDPESQKAATLNQRGVELRRGDQEDVTSLVEAFDGLSGLFFMATFADDVEGEVRRGAQVGDAAARAGVPLVVYSSVGGAERHSGVPHFESKRRIEEHLEGVITGQLKVIRPVYFMDNLAGMLGEEDPFVLRMPMPGTTPLQLIAVRDIGRVAAALLLDPDALETTAVEIAGDELTPDAIAVIIGEHLGRPARYEQATDDVLPDDDLRAMFRWFTDTPAYAADRAMTQKLDPAVWDLRAWLENGKRR